MPLITIHTSSEDQNDQLVSKVEEIKEFASKELSCGPRKLDPSEFSVRIITSDYSKSIADIEIVIIAHSYSERVEKQDQICLSFKRFVEKHCPPHTVYVWLQLSELGHSA